MKIFQKIVAFFVSLAQGPGGRVVHDAVASIVENVGPVLFSQLVEIAKAAISAREGGSVPAVVKHDVVANIIKRVAAQYGVTLNDTTVDLIIKAALLAVRKVGA